jgi:hypothetical protein
LATVSGVDTFDATATSAQILIGQTAYVDGQKITGTMPNQGAKTATLDAGNSYTIPKGYHDGTGKVSAQTLASQTDGTATAAQILSGQTAWVDGEQITGSMANRTNKTTAFCGYEAVTVQTHPVDSNQALVTAPNSYGTVGYYDSTSYVTANVANLKPDNIKAGVKVGRYNGDETNCIVGTFTSDATATAADIASGLTAWVNGQKLTGTLNKAVFGTVSGSGDKSLTIPDLIGKNAFFILRSNLTDKSNDVKGAMMSISFLSVGNCAYTYSPTSSTSVSGKWNGYSNDTDRGVTFDNTTGTINSTNNMNFPTSFTYYYIGI